MSINLMVTTQKHVKGLYKLISVCNLDICALYNYFVTIHFHFVGLKRKKLGNDILNFKSKERKSECVQCTVYSVQCGHMINVV